MTETASRQGGVALITALFVVSLAVIAGVAMFQATNLAVHRTENIQDSEAAWWYTDAVERWVLSLLQQDAKLHEVDSLADDWAQPVLVLPIERGTVNGSLEDLQGRFNLNNLGALNPKPYIDQFQRLVAALPGHYGIDGADVAGAVRDWIDQDSAAYSTTGAKDDYYINLQPGYRTAGRLMVSPSELLLVKGVTADLYAALKPYVTALPTTGAKINLNTAPLPVLVSLSSKSGYINPGFVQTRLHEPLRSVADAVTAGLFPKDSDISQYADVKTQYFLLHSAITIGRGRVEAYSLIYRPRNGQATVMQHSEGTE